MATPKPEKLPDVLRTIRECIEQERYLFTAHALERVKERGIDVYTAIYVLLNGYEEKQKTTFDSNKKTWKYAVRGKTLEDVDVRVVVAFCEDDMLVITVMHVGDL